MTPTEATTAWVRDFVVRLGLCPFAAAPLRDGRVKYLEIAGEAPDDLLRAWLRQLSIFLEQEAEEVSTTLVIFSEGLRDFEDFLDFIDAATHLISESGAEPLVQLAHFHPDYRFAGVAADDPGNRTNRAPYPTLQFLRTEEVSVAVDNYPDVEGIPDRNVALLRKLFSDGG